MLIKSTTAICAAVGAQPIRWQTCPILTSLQVVMVSAHVHQRARTKLARRDGIITALGVNVGAGVLLREVPSRPEVFSGWGNVSAA